MNRRKNMSKSFVLKPEKCIGCRTCEIICSYNRVGEFAPERSCVNVINFEKALLCVPIMCTQCEEAACAKVCPVNAISRDDNGAMAVDEKKCIVCKMCVSACPLGNIAFDTHSRKVFKCNYCGGDPNCAKYCPSGAIEYTEMIPSALTKRQAVADKFSELFGEEE